MDRAAEEEDPGTTLDNIHRKITPYLRSRKPSKVWHQESQLSLSGRYKLSVWICFTPHVAAQVDTASDNITTTDIIQIFQQEQWLNTAGNSIAPLFRLIRTGNEQEDIDSAVPYLPAKTMTKTMMRTCRSAPWAMVPRLPLSLSNWFWFWPSSQSLCVCVCVCVCVCAHTQKEMVIYEFFPIRYAQYNDYVLTSAYSIVSTRAAN